MSVSDLEKITFSIHWLPGEISNQCIKENNKMYESHKTFDGQFYLQYKKIRENIVQIQLHEIFVKWIKKFIFSIDFLKKKVHFLPFFQPHSTGIHYFLLYRRKGGKTLYYNEKFDTNVSIYWRRCSLIFKMKFILFLS